MASTGSENTGFQASVLSIVAGYADSLSYLSFGAFAGLMTGNTVLLGIALLSPEPRHALQNLLIIVMFISGVGMSALSRRVGVRLSMLLTLEGLALTAASLLPPAAAAPTLALAMGVQNAAATRFSGATLNTVFLTGDLQKLTQALVHRLSRSHGEQPGNGIGVLALVYVSYLIGVLLGAAAHALLPRPLLFAVVLLPVSLLRSESHRQSGQRPMPRPNHDP